MYSGSVERAVVNVDNLVELARQLLRELRRDIKLGGEVNNKAKHGARSLAAGMFLILVIQSSKSTMRNYLRWTVAYLAAIRV